MNLHIYLTYNSNYKINNDVASYALGALILRLDWRRPVSDLTILCGDDNLASFDSSVGEMPREAKSMLGKSVMSEEARAGATFLPGLQVARSPVLAST